MMPDADIGSYEGLIRSTAARYAPLLDDDFEDVAQILRLKVWQALTAYNSARSTLDVKNYVFGCVRNRLKDLFKQQDRLNDRRGGGQLSILEIAGETPEAFDAKYLCVDQEVAYFSVEDEDVTLPSTLNELECSVVQLLLLDFNQTEIARHLGVTRARVRSAHAAVQSKMADWHPGTGAVESRQALAA